MDRVQARPTSCCTPSRGGATAPAPAATAHTGGHETDMALLPGGTFLMGAEDADGFPTDGEGPVREVAVAAFRIDVHAVTNERFARFVRETGHVTEAERFGWSYAFAGFLPAAPRPEGTPWWCGVEGASWRAPEGLPAADWWATDHADRRRADPSGPATGTPR